MYISIDLKSFYASVECISRGLDPMNTNLVVADSSRTEKTICLAVTPSLKAYGIPGRARLFEVIQKVNAVNRERLKQNHYHKFTGKSYLASELNIDSSLKLDFIIAPPRMAKYMEISTEIYNIYLKYIAPEDILVYSIDEVFMDVSAYLTTYKMTAHELAMTMIQDVLKQTGITATAGIGTNMYLAKVAMDVMAKKMPPDKDGVRIAELDEMTYRRELWEHTPITDFWRVGKGIAKKLEANHMYTMGDVAECSEYNEEKLYKLFGINAELLIDHAWGWEPCTIKAAKEYIPENRSISQGQVLSCAYSFENGQLIIREMTELLVLELVKKKIVTDQIVLTVGYDNERIPKDFNGKFEKDRYGRKIPKSAHGSINLENYTSSTKKIMNAVITLYRQIVDKNLQVRRIYVVANHIKPENAVTENFIQLDLFTDTEEMERRQQAEKKSYEKERSIQKAVISIKERFGKNAVLKGMNLQEGATTIERNSQVGGHKA